MDRVGHGLRRKPRSAVAVGERDTLTSMVRSAWFWVGWLCLAAAVAAVFDGAVEISPAAQILLVVAAVLAFDRHRPAGTGSAA